MSEQDLQLIQGISQLTHNIYNTKVKVDNVQRPEIALGIIQTALTTRVISHVVAGRRRGGWGGQMFRNVCVKQLLTN